MSTLRRWFWRVVRVLMVAAGALGPGMPPRPPPSPAPTEQVLEKDDEAP